MLVIEKVTSELSVDLAPRHPRHLILSNPVMIASGTFGNDGYGEGLNPDVDLSLLGAVIPKTVTPCFRIGNAEPRRYPKSFGDARENLECVF